MKPIMAWAVLVIEGGRISLMGTDPKQPEVFATKADAARETKKWEDAKYNGWLTFPVRVRIEVVE